MPIVVLATTKTGNNFNIYSMVTEKFKTRKKFTALLAFIAIFLSLGSFQYQKSITATFIASLMFTHRAIVPVGRCINFINF